MNFETIMPFCLDRGMQDRIAYLLKTDKESLKRFEDAYRKSALSETTDTGSVFDINSRDMSAYVRSQELPKDYDEQRISQMISDIVDELICKTDAKLCLNGRFDSVPLLPSGNGGAHEITNEEIKLLPEKLRPQLTGSLMAVDIDSMSYIPVLSMYELWQNGKTAEEKKRGYHMFRQGLDILDLDPVVYQMLGMNRNAMSFWLPPISAAARAEGFFKIPETRIAKVPMTLLQLSRKDYYQLTPTTLKIVDDWAMKAFGLDVHKTYFIKTGTFSSKYDFRNAKVTGEKEVRELGEYLLFIQYQASQMAGPLAMPSMYGASTTNEWVVREFIEDVEDNPCIYMGLPLHTEYRVFVDFDTNDVIGVSPYWEPSVMLKRFSDGSETSPHHWHDYVIYKAHEDTLMGRYERNRDKVIAHVRDLLPYATLDGQWSIDIMQNGDDFWLIDMATADTSALCECVPKELLKKPQENWLPDFGTILELESGDMIHS